MKELLKAIIPPRIWTASRDFFFNLFDLYGHKSYSQEGEDMILRRIFEHVESGFYIDIGAHHPKRFSNTYFFYKKGWSGINIDAMPGIKKRFDKVRPRDKTIEAAVANERKEMTYYIFNDPAINTFDYISAQKSISNNYRVVKKQKIVTKMLKEILADNVPNDKKINFMDIDVEGLDLEVIKSNDFDLYRPEYILIESHGAAVNDIQNNEIYKFLSEKKYELFAKTVQTLIFKDVYREISCSVHRTGAGGRK